MKMQVCGSTKQHKTETARWRRGGRSGPYQEIKYGTEPPDRAQFSLLDLQCGANAPGTHRGGVERTAMRRAKGRASGRRTAGVAKTPKRSGEEAPC